MITLFFGTEHYKHNSFMHWYRVSSPYVVILPKSKKGNSTTKDRELQRYLIIVLCVYYRFTRSVQSIYNAMNRSWFNWNSEGAQLWKTKPYPHSRPIASKITHLVHIHSSFPSFVSFSLDRVSYMNVSHGSLWF